ALYLGLRYEPLPTVLRLAGSPKPPLRAGAMFLLRKFNTQPAALGALLPGLKDKDVRVRRWAVASLGAFLNERRAVEALVAQLDDPDVVTPGDLSVAEQAARCFWNAAASAESVMPAIPALGKVARTGKGRLQGMALRSLGLIGKKGKTCAAKALPHL